jgi:hypothetical protein
MMPRPLLYLVFYASMSATSIRGLTKHSFGAIFLLWNGRSNLQEFSHLWDGLTEAEQVDVNAKVILLQKIGPGLPRPHADLIHSSRHPNMKELRVQHSGRPYRVLFAFDPRRCAILLIGGDKTGNDRWYEEFVPIADALYDRHLDALKKEEK